MTTEQVTNGVVKRQRGPVLDKIDEEKVGKHLQKLGIEPIGDKRGKVEKLIRALGELKEPNGQKPRLAHCDTCNCDSPPASMGYEDCPFCGDEEMDDEMKLDASKVVPDDEKDPADESLDNEDHTEDEEETDAFAADADDEEEQVPEPKQVKTTALAVRSIKADRTQDLKKTKTVSVKVEMEQKTLSTATDLDTSVRRVHELSDDIRLNGWLLGKELAKIYDGKLWETRKDAKGKQTYKSFVEFLQEECHLERGTASHLMDVATFTEDEVKQFGQSKCSVLVRLPPEKRAERIERLKNDLRMGKKTSYKELLDEIRQVAPVRPSAFKGTPAWEKEGKREKVVEVAAQPKVTAVLVLGRNRVPLFQGKDKETRARKLADDPRGELMLANGVLASFRVATDASGDLFVTFEVARDVSPKPEKKAKKPVSKEKAIASAKKQTRKAVSKANATREKAAKKTAAKKTKRK